MSGPVVKSSRDVDGHTVKRVRGSGYRATAAVPWKVDGHNGQPEVFEITPVTTKVGPGGHHAVQEQDRVHGSTS